MNTIASKHSYVLGCKGENWKRLEQHQVEIISQKKYVVMVFFLNEQVIGVLVFLLLYIFYG